MKALLAILLLSLAGCTIDREGTVHHVIIGFGVVSVSKTNTVAQVTKTKAVGVYAGPGNFCVGFGSSLSTSVKTNANVVIEVK